MAAVGETRRGEVAWGGEGAQKGGWRAFGGTSGEDGGGELSAFWQLSPAKQTVSSAGVCRFAT